MSAVRTGPRRFLVCIAFETEKLVRRRLPWITLVITALTALGTGLIQGTAGEAPESYRLYAVMLENTMPVAAFFLLIMGCLAVNEEIATGKKN